MTSKKYVFSNAQNTPKGRVNVFQLNKQVQAQARVIALLQRQLAHQTGVNAQQVLLNESLSDRVALLERESWARNKNVFRRCVNWALGK